MNTKTTLAILVLALLLVGVAWLIFRSVRQRRSEGMRAFAGQHGWEYAKDDTGLLGTLTGLPYFSKSRSQEATTNVLRTEVDSARVTYFDYSYAYGGPNRRGSLVLSFLLLESTRLDLPTFEMRPMSRGGQKLERFLPGHERAIEIEDQPEFSAVYWLQGPDEARIRTVFGAEQAAFFAAHHKWWVEGSGQKLVLFSPSMLLSPTMLPSFLEEGRAALRVLAS